MTPRKVAQPLELEYDTIDGTKHTEKPKPKKPATSKKGQHRGGKWSWTDAERTLLLEQSNEFDQALIGPGSFWGYRISELLSLKVDDVMDEHGYLRPFVVVPSERLKGGKPRVAKPLPPKPANHDADCPCNLCNSASLLIAKSPWVRLHPM